MKQTFFILGGLAVLVGVYFLGVTKGFYDKVNFGTYATTFKQELMNQQIGETDLGLLWTVTDLIDEKYIGDINYRDVLYGAIKGSVWALNDPYTTFTDPTENKDFFDVLDGIYEGIGVEIEIIDGRLVVIAPTKDGPAEAAGIKPKDEIYAVDGVSVTGMTIPEVVSRIKGPVGTTVTLAVGRDGLEEPLVVSVKREVVKRKSVFLEMRDGVAVLTITRFGSDTEGLLKTSINEILAQGAKGVVLDMRGNPGGFLDVGVKVANEFLKSGVIVEERFKDGQSVPFSADGGGRLTNLPVVVVVDGGSASAAEIVAGALQDHQRARVVGEQTYGKGSVQEVETFPDGSALRITVAKWYTPDGRSISDDGIKPDKMVVYDPDSETDDQLTTALEVLLSMLG
ncbi:MAG: S41 family peptidase [Patescibacteria group bacterium]|nr:S41 family peptidase [Patescibacteria group bacterium]